MKYINNIFDKLDKLAKSNKKQKCNKASKVSLHLANITSKACLASKQSKDSDYVCEVTPLSKPRNVVLTTECNYSYKHSQSPLTTKKGRVHLYNMHVKTASLQQQYLVLSPISTVPLTRCQRSRNTIKNRVLNI